MESRHEEEAPEALFEPVRTDRKEMEERLAYVQAELQEFEAQGRQPPEKRCTMHDAKAQARGGRILRCEHRGPWAIVEELGPEGTAVVHRLVYGEDNATNVRTLVHLVSREWGQTGWYDVGRERSWRAYRRLLYSLDAEEEAEKLIRGWIREVRRDFLRRRGIWIP